MRYLFENDCVLVFKLIVPAILLTVIGIIIKVGKMRTLAQNVLFLFYLFLVIHNFIIILQAGLINF